MNNHQAALTWYKRFVRLYPRAYRDQYESEMIETFVAMLSDVHTRREYRALSKLVIKDYFVTILRQYATMIAITFATAPRLVKRSTFISLALIVPFFSIVFYNVLSLVMYHSVVPHIRELEAQTWVIYSIVLPLMAFFIIAWVAFQRTYISLRQRHWQQAGRTIFTDGLIVGMPVALLAIIAIF